MNGYQWKRAASDNDRVAKGAYRGSIDPMGSKTEGEFEYLR
jgi:hypothetical protein